MAFSDSLLAPARGWTLEIRLLSVQIARSPLENNRRFSAKSRTSETASKHIYQNVGKQILPTYLGRSAMCTYLTLARAIQFPTCAPLRTATEPAVTGTDRKSESVLRFVRFRP